MICYGYIFLSDPRIDVTRSIQGVFISAETIDQFNKFHNAPVPYPTMLYSEQKCVIISVLNGALWDIEQVKILDLWIRSIVLFLQFQWSNGVSGRCMKLDDT